MINYKAKAAFIILLSLCVLSSCAHRRKERTSVQYQTREQIAERVPVDEDPNDKPATEKPQQIHNEGSLETPIGGPNPSQILKRLSFTLSYNHETKNPNWVGWCLTAEHTDGEFPRKGVPYYDENGEAIGIGNVTPETLHNGYFLDLESEEPRQLLSDWFNNPYRMTHGHMCPAADNKWSKAAMNQSFLLTNMCPQDGTLNGGAWQKLEDKCRTWARQYKEIYIVAGPLYDNGKVTRTIGNSKVAVPDAFFKVVLCLTGSPKAIGFIYRNDNSSQNMRDAACSVDAVESITGLDFFSSFPDDIESEMESQTNFNAW